MGNRGSISVKNRDEESVTLFKHWSGDKEQFIMNIEKAFELMLVGYRYNTESSDTLEGQGYKNRDETEEIRKILNQVPVDFDHPFCCVLPCVISCNLP